MLLCNFSTGEGMRKTYAVGKRRSITGELLKRRDFGRKNTEDGLKQSSLKGGALVEWDHQGGHQVLWDHAHSWRELVTWHR